jgi:uncharacterized membrane protein
MLGIIATPFFGVKQFLLVFFELAQCLKTDWSKAILFNIVSIITLNLVSHVQPERHIQERRSLRCSRACNRRQTRVRKGFGEPAVLSSLELEGRDAAGA